MNHHKKVHLVTIRMSEAERRSIEQEAKRVGSTMSDVVRRGIEQALRAKGDTSHAC